MQLDLDQLTGTVVPDDLAGLPLTQLRALRDEQQELENGISYARRMIQGRMDMVATELDRRRGGGVDQLIARLPDALAGGTRGPGLPRHVPKLEPPEWADGVVEAVDREIPVVIDESTDDLALVTAMESLDEAEKQLSDERRNLHRVIDRIQDELVARYREGASVDDLLN